MTEDVFSIEDVEQPELADLIEAKRGKIHNLEAEIEDVEHQGVEAEDYLERLQLYSGEMSLEEELHRVEMEHAELMILAVKMNRQNMEGEN